MNSFIYPSAILELVTGGLDFMRDDFAVMLLPPDHAPDPGDSVRAELGDEITAAVKTDILVDDASDGISVILGGAEWPDSSIIAGYAAYYRNTGNALSDSLIALVDFGRLVQSINDVFRLTETRINISA